jgi:hypothetical protein
MMGRSGHAAHVVGNYLYVLGGYTWGPTNAVERAAIDADGNLGLFGPTTPLAFPRSDFVSEIGGNRVFAIGGAGLPAVEAAEIDSADNLVAPFLDANVTTTVVRQFAKSVAIRGWIYVLGGVPSEPAGAYATIERAPIPDQTGDGDLTVGLR